MVLRGLQLLCGLLLRERLRYVALACPTWPLCAAAAGAETRMDVVSPASTVRAGVAIGDAGTADEFEVILDSDIDLEIFDSMLRLRC